MNHLAASPLSCTHIFFPSDHHSSILGSGSGGSAITTPTAADIRELIIEVVTKMNDLDQRLVMATARLESKLLNPNPKKINPRQSSGWELGNLETQIASENASCKSALKSALSYSAPSTLQKSS